MSNNDRPVNYPIAKGPHGEWVNISEAKRGDHVFCPECSSPFNVRLGGKRKHHFAHRAGNTAICAGESGYHNLAKHLVAYYYEKQGKINLIAECLVCGYIQKQTREILTVEVEKGDSEYRPDARLMLGNNEKIDCEIVYRNPLGEKLNLHKEQQTSLLVWFITRQVVGVPRIYQISWQELGNHDESFLKRNHKDSLILLASPTLIDHECAPYGEAYIGEYKCVRCKQHTKIARLSTWFHCWGDISEIDSKCRGFDGPTYSYVLYRNLPVGFSQALNKQFDTHLGVDYTTYPDSSRKYYVMNHCHCGTKIPDGYINKGINDDEIDTSKFFKVKVTFELTAYEREALNRSIINGQPLGSTIAQEKNGSIW